MGHVSKKPFALWGDRDAPAQCDKNGHDTAATYDCDARWKWGYDDHYADWETVAMDMTGAVTIGDEASAAVVLNADAELEYTQPDGSTSTKTGDIVDPGTVDLDSS